MLRGKRARIGLVRLRPRDARWPVHEPHVPGEPARPRHAVDGDQAQVYRGEPVVRQLDQGHAVVEGRWRLRAVDDAEQGLGAGSARPCRRVRLAVVRRRVLPGLPRSAVRRLPGAASLQDHPQQAADRRPPRCEHGASRLQADQGRPSYQVRQAHHGQRRHIVRNVPEGMSTMSLSRIAST
jgi:hypothetical protein